MRRRLKPQDQRWVDGDLVTRLTDELQSNRETGQPMIYEEAFEGGRMRVTVLWDEWERLSLEDRTSVILEAYSKAEGPETRRQIVLASGLTIPEAESSGLLPFQVLPALRKDDLVTFDECREAMINVGASVLFDPRKPKLRLATLDDAETAVRELVKQLPNSEPVWVVSREAGMVDDWQQR